MQICGKIDEKSLLSGAIFDDSLNLKDFLNIVNGKADGNVYNQLCKGKHSKIIGIEWTSANEILFVTSQGLELYQASSFQI